MSSDEKTYEEAKQIVEARIKKMKGVMVDPEAKELAIAGVMGLKRYILAVKKTHRDTAPHNWMQLVTSIPEVIPVVGATSKMVVFASEKAHQELISDFSYLHVEPDIQHFTCEQPAPKPSPMATDSRGLHEKYFQDG